MSLKNYRREFGTWLPCMLKINIFKKFCFLLFHVLKINDSLNNCITLCKIFNDHILTRQWSDKEVSFVRVSARHCVLRFCMYFIFQRWRHSPSAPTAGRGEIHHATCSSPMSLTIGQNQRSGEYLPFLFLRTFF